MDVCESFIYKSQKTEKAKHSSLRYTHTIEYYSATEKEQTTDEHNNMDENPKHYAEQKRSQTPNCMIDSFK